VKTALDLIEQIIEEHKTIRQRLQSMEEVANDTEALRGFEKAQEGFMPGRFDQKLGLGRLEELVNLVDQGLQTHFDREETALLAAFEEQGDRELASAFHSLLLEHRDLRNRLAHTRDHISQLTGGELPRHHWEATAYDMRAHISHTRRLLEAHAEVEQELLQSLRRRLLGGEKE
jgi:iron-sulfur cluster repair protein YtfE (RIC family)